jgi:hypothetical protein
MDAPFEKYAGVVRVSDEKAGAMKSFGKMVDAQGIEPWTSPV